MTHIRFLKVVLPMILLPAAATIFMPELVMGVYVDVVEPAALLAASFLALRVSFIYRKEMKAAFIFLSLFLLVYALTIILFMAQNPVLLPVLESRLDITVIHSMVPAIQFIIYAILLFFCINLLKVVDVTRLNRTGWVLLAVTAVFCFLLAVVPVREVFSRMSALEVWEVFNLIIRGLDALLIIVLVPVLWLYVQYLKSQERQSLTFTVIISGIVCATVFDYIVQMIISVFPMLQDGNPSLYFSIREALYIFGFLVICAGLYAHWKQDEWGFRTVDRIMSGDLETAVETDE